VGELNLCQYVECIGKSGNGNELYRCTLNDVRLGSLSAGICLMCDNNPNCKPKIPEPVEEPVEETICMNYVGDGPKNCCWVIECPAKIVSRDVRRIKRWTDETVLSSGTISLEQPASRIYQLEIIGEGYDDRCTWCRSFRTTLGKHANTLVKISKNCPYKQDNVSYNFNENSIPEQVPC
jgi:hypothetical protein